MNWPRIIKVLVPVFMIAVLLVALDGKENTLSGWLAYEIMLLLNLAILGWVNQFLAVKRSIFYLALAASLTRLVVGVAFMELLPVVGYQDNVASQAGYIFKDAFFRDQNSWHLARSDAPISEAFSGSYQGDQYGGMLALCMAIYRLFHPGAHRPYLILIVNGAAAGLGVLFLWRAIQTWMHANESGVRDQVARLAAILFAFYPEYILLSSSIMREAIVIPSVAVAFWGFTQMNLSRYRWLVGILVGFGLLFIFQPPIAMATIIALAGLWALETNRQLSWSKIVLFGGLFLAGLIGIILVWSNLPSLKESGSLNLIVAWLQKNFGYQSYLIERGSGTFQNLLRKFGENWRLAIVLVKGMAEPVLPAVIVAPAAPIWKITNILRSLGWYLVAPVLFYGLFVGWMRREQSGWAQRFWLNVFVILGTIIAVINAGGDQWDNPRYRTLLLVWIALVCSWWWVSHRTDIWFKRIFMVEAVFILVFMEWYLARYFHLFVNLGIMGMILITLGTVLVLFLVWWFKDRIQIHQRNQ